MTIAGRMGGAIAIGKPELLEVGKAASVGDLFHFIAVINAPTRWSNKALMSAIGPKPTWASAHVRFWVNSGHRSDIRECPLMT